MSDFKETATFLIPKEYLSSTKEDKRLKEYIVNHLSSELANRIIGILEREEEIIISQSDLRASEHMPTNSIEYKRQINWSPLIRCKECRWGKEVCENIECFVDSNIPPEYHDYEWFCPNGERKK